MKLLTPAQHAQYLEKGYIAPVRIMSVEQAAAIRQRLEAFEREHGGPLKGSMRHKSHLLFSWLADLVRYESILDAVEDLYGPNLLCWTSNFFIKEACDPGYVSWHQDSTYWGLSRPDVVTAWVALSSSTVSNGAMQVIPGSHLSEQLAHRDTFAANNLLTRGQEIAVSVDPALAHTIELEPGEMSLHHVRIIHGSPPNLSNARRIGFAIRYIPCSVYQERGSDSATLVRGVDPIKKFEHEPRPTRDMAPEFVSLHAAMTQRNAAILYEGTEVKNHEDSVPKR
jgi:hypothetical protein